ncbi:hypothetical protein HIM_10319 [Hirsutella minnesotensis 3608]|uniref:NAD dependent epimerase/dehydratase n=1 Tax=Hirsutella minnesotensis 3608 TaxID=1043627 RepID=A0A0F7ZK74_9HYPO|nr:hypothetical protein HIM_10319 [Hirsutella minnesotensis 3608]
MAHTSPSGVPDRVVPMRVIVCGLHRTGTMSTRTALWQLGFHDCYHMQTVMQNVETHPQQWIRAFEAKYAGKGTLTKADWDRLLGHCQASCDFPIAIFSAELAEVYPDAKVVILNRDPEAWYESVLQTIYPYIKPSNFWQKLIGLYCRTFDPQTRNWANFSMAMSTFVMPFDHGLEKDKAISWFNAQYAEFRERIPEHRRIEWSVKDGWKPLCEHLGVPVPTVKDEKTGKLVEAPFPRVNDRDSFHILSRGFYSRALKRANDNMVNGLGRLTLTAVLGYGGFLAWKTNLWGRL